MKSQSTISFILAAIIYSLVLFAGYWLWATDIVKIETTPKLTKVPVTLAMFSEPAPIIETPIEVKTPVEPVVEPIVEKTPEPIEETIEEPVVEPIKPPVIKPEPVKKKPEPKKEAKTESKKVVKKQPPKQDVEPKPIQKPVKPAKAVTQSAPKPEVKTAETQKVAKKPAMNSYSTEQVENAEQNYLQALRKQILTYAQDTYPRRAKRRHWEGNVVIKFNLNTEGYITQLKIIESSGRSILDQAALEIFQVKMAYHFKPFPKEIKRKNWAIKVPVTYNLR
ncbi:energy transducer TonB [Thiomicrorhabdus sp. Kp2]|uniref:energy transducer TonB n=1 Tax=Thiomicrorhabdus sp. Kp2 TaxID=1123518 RepID=UPI0004032AA9|nr:energy transducer TonB [Thiomicrorhabdus sp. Kp2]